MTAIHTEPGLAEALADCVAALRRVASYRLPTAMNRRLLWLSENQEQLSPDEREELAEAIEFAEDRTLEKLQAQAALKRLATVYPDVVNGQT